jgi:hypothetical protein
MKKLINFALLFTVLFASCKKDVQSSDAALGEDKVLSFGSKAAMQIKIDEIASFKKTQEAQIMEKILKRNNLTAPVATDFRNNSNATIDKNLLLEDLKFYHTERLNAIYAERAHFKFTSIQSIADEINSLKLLNPTKANVLYSQFSSLLQKDAFLISTVFGKEEGFVINEAGEIMLEGKKINSTSIGTSEGFGNTAKFVKQGILAQNSFYIITWHAGANDGSLAGDTERFTQLASFVNFGQGYVLYPSWFFTNTASYASFSSDFGISSVAFQPGIGSTVTNNAFSTQVVSFSANFGGGSNVSGNFVVLLSGQYIPISGAVLFW